MHRLPSLFVSHGAPTFALAPGTAGVRLGELGRRLPRPQAVLVVSPHWTTLQPRVGTAARPRILHDFGGFDEALYGLDYPAAGHPALAERTLALLDAAGWQASADAQRGLDHGAWVPLLHLYPQADVPVYQVSLPAGLDADGAWLLGRSLAPLSTAGVLIVGSGSLTHNLHDVRGIDHPAQAYATEFAAWVGDAVRSAAHERLRRALDSAPHAQRAHPTPEHFWPLLVAAGAARPGSAGHVLAGGIAHGALAMDACLFGDLPAPPAGATAH